MNLQGDGHEKIGYGYGSLLCLGSAILHTIDGIVVRGQGSHFEVWGESMFHLAKHMEIG